MLLELAKKNIKIVRLVLILLAVAAAVAAIVSATLDKKTFYKGIYIEGIDVSSLDLKQAKMVVEEQLLYQLKNIDIRLVCGDFEQKIKFEDLTYKFMIDEAVERAWNIGRKGDILKRIKDIISTRSNNVNIEVESGFNRDKLHNLLRDIKKKTDIEACNAAITFNNGKISIKKETIGTSLDIDINQKIVEDYIMEGKSGKIELRVNEKTPEIKLADIKDIKDVIASFSTTFSTHQSNRSFNIKLACRRISGTILPVGKVFSMDGALGPRTVENGYKEAPVIFKNEFIPGAGGGVCQVTTTLYGAVLKSDMEVVERRHHSMPLGYVEPGQDATIAEGYIDFKFKNDRDYPVCIYAFVEGNKLETRLYGKKKPNHHVIKISSRVVEEIFPEDEEYIIDDSVPDGEVVVEREARVGMKVIVYKEKYNSYGELLDLEKISEDVYRPIKSQVKVNQNYYNNIIYTKESSEDDNG